MSFTQRKNFIHQTMSDMHILKIALIALFALVFFMSYAIPSLKDTYGYRLTVFSQ